ncbi:hypothetical protein ANN_15804 [Periplaneta americana]|uniref:Uncharacterized protein n=1 Tax=Periplaneta americana TaxID=6978 RepID=A0ABQ8SJ67_PERAM|nr:hypothetical protein ANN_15804 [Periplaneta americana]
MLAGNEFQSLGRAIVKEDEYEEVRWYDIVSIVSWRERVFRLWWEERRADIIIIDRQKDKGVILDPTIRFEMHEQQPQEVCLEKQVIYEPCCQHLEAQYHITHWTVFGLMFGARGTIPRETLNQLKQFKISDATIDAIGSHVRTYRHDTTVHDVIRLLIPALYKNQSDSLMAADGDCHHLCKLMAPVRHRWSINDDIGGIRNTVMPSDCSPTSVRAATFWRQGELKGIQGVSTKGIQEEQHEYKENNGSTKRTRDIKGEQEEYKENKGYGGYTR